MVGDDGSAYFYKLASTSAPALKPTFTPAPLSLAEVRFQTGSVLQLRGRLEEAISNYDKAILLNPPPNFPQFTFGIE